jgi:prepilin-type N-terminal cleavage/methylation domain-containing protein
MTSNYRTNAGGFTLIELVVSLTIMAMVSAAVLSGLRTGLLVWDKGNRHIDDLRHSGVVVQLLHGAIGSALPFVYTVKAESRPVQTLAFEAGHDHLRFVSRYSFKDGPNSLPRWIEIRWHGDAGKNTGELVVEERYILPPDNLPQSTVYWSGKLLQADTCVFDFLENLGDKPAAWTREWHPSLEQLPKAVRVRCVAQSKEMVSVTRLDYSDSFAAGLRLN